MLSASVNINEKKNMTEAVAALAAKVTGVSAASTVTLAATLDIPHMFGYTVEQWQIIGIITGIVMGAGGLTTTILFQWLNYRLKALRRSAVDD